MVLKTCTSVRWTVTFAVTWNEFFGTGAGESVSNFPLLFLVQTKRHKAFSCSGEYPGNHRMIWGHPKYLCLLPNSKIKKWYIQVSLLYKQNALQCQAKRPPVSHPVRAWTANKARALVASRLFARPVIHSYTPESECITQQICTEANQ